MTERERWMAQALELAREALGREIQSILAQKGIASAVTHYTERERGGLCLF